jgi:undecaprenyl-phosphate 4-deoxy-4-formamido-L-arabinose transferase
MSITVVVPCYRSAAMLAELVAGLETELFHLTSSGNIDDWELILVIDGSPDETGRVAEDLATNRENVRTLHLRRNFGQHNALLAGIKLARFDVVVTMDDDLQHRPDQVGALVSALGDQSLDLVYGVPIDEEHGFARSAASRVVKSALSLAGVPNVRWVSAFRAFRIDLRNGFDDVVDPNPNLDVMLSWTTSSVAPVSVLMNRRREGRSSYGLIRLTRHALNMVTGYGVAPLKIATFMGFLFGLFGLVLVLVVIVNYVSGETTVAGFTTIAAMIALFSGAQLISLGIMGEYLGRLYFRTMGKPTYLIAGQEPSSGAPVSRDQDGCDSL